MALPSFVAAGAYLEGSAANAPVAIPSGTAAGRVAVVSMFIDGAAVTVTPAPGFQAAEGSPSQIAAGSGAHSLHVFWKRLSGSEAGTWTFSWGTSRYREAIACLYDDVVASGVPFDSPTDTAQDLGNSTATPPVDVTTAGADRRLVWAATNWGGGTWTIPPSPAGFVKRAQGGAGVFTVCDAPFAAAGSTGDVIGTCTGNDKRCVWLGALIGTTSAGATHEAQAASSTTATLAGTAAATKPSPADAAVTTSTSAGTAATKPVSASAAASATLAAVASVTKPATGAGSFTAALAADSVASKPVAASLQIAASLAADLAASSLQEAQATAIATAALAAAGHVDHLGAAAMAATAALSGAGEAVRPASAAVLTSAALSAEAALVKPVHGLLAAAMTASAQSAGPGDEQIGGMFGTGAGLLPGVESSARAQVGVDASMTVRSGPDW
ncbi:hypothetical protein [Nonomuraea sp. NPDC050202]|uniref:hypothetical protein n=1 Tax=Nonomuraea sp. NPDC050202 TaxID=3155035 RepID=UPI0033FBD9AE